MSKKKTATQSKEWPFSGEQYVPSVRGAEISYEHWHRYFLATEFVENKVVLDIACGEGYGSHLISQHAQHVVGVDVNPGLVEHATAKYASDDSGRIEFCIGRAGSIPISGVNIFDIAISYETIEHLDEQEQCNFLAEIKRVVKKDGLLLISTPNKLLYSDIPAYKNEFHVKEFYAEEFEHFLRQYFTNVSFLHQRVYPVSYIWSHEEPHVTLREYRMRDDGEGLTPTDDDEPGMYIVALCSEGPLPKYGSSILVDLTHRLLREKDERIAAQMGQLAEKDIQLAHVTRQLEAVTNSRSWRITAPIRILGKKLLSR